MTKELSQEAILENPKDFGLPTFEEFRRSPDKWLGSWEDTFDSAYKSSQDKFLRSHIQRHIYEIEGYKCKTLEEVEKVARSQGIDLRSLDYRPEMIPQGGGKWDVKVVFVSKNQRDRRNEK